MKILLLFFVILLRLSSATPCKDWLQVNDDKCLKIINDTIETTTTFEQADALCRNLTNANLFVVESDQEQRFLIQQLYEKNNIANDFWIGLKRENRSKQFRWINGKEFRYSNWAVGYPTTKALEDCVQVNQAETSSETEFTKSKGKWTNVLCKRKNSVVCQKRPEWDLHELSEFVVKFKAQTLERNRELIKELDLLKDNPVPVGFIYVQLPSQPAPADIWPKVYWQDVSSTYAGDFFRVYGGNSSAFGYRQNGCSPRIVRAMTHNRDNDKTYRDEKVLLEEVPEATTTWTKGLLGTGSQKSDPWRDLQFKLNQCEVRPQNQAVKVWKRIR